MWWFTLPPKVLSRSPTRRNYPTSFINIVHFFEENKGAPKFRLFDRTSLTKSFRKVLIDKGEQRALYWRGASQGEYGPLRRRITPVGYLWGNSNTEVKTWRRSRKRMMEKKCLPYVMQDPTSWVLRAPRFGVSWWVHSTSMERNYSIYLHVTWSNWRGHVYLL